MQEWNRKIQREKDEILKQNDNLQTYLRAKESQVCGLETSLTKAQQSLKDMQERKRKIQREKDEILKQKDNLQTYLRAKESQVCGLETSLTKAQQSLKDMQERKRKIQREKDEILKQKDNLQTYLRAKESQVCGLETSLTKAQQSLKDMQERKRKIQREKDEILKQKDNLRAKVHQLETSLRTSQQAFSKNMQRLEVENKELKCQWKKERSELLEQKESSERELFYELVERNSWQKRFRAKEDQVRELETSLTIARGLLDEYQQKEPWDWVISRDEVQMTGECLGKGGWGKVVLGTFRGCKVAVKHIHEPILSPHNRQLFEIEANIASKCRHPCLLQFIGATNDNGIPLFITELLDTSLRALLEQRHLADTEISIISLDVSLALNYLHNMKPSIIHRDVSSANVLLWQRGNQWRGKLSDYGTANFVQRRMTEAPGAVIYSAPEAVTPKQTSKVSSSTMH